MEVTWCLDMLDRKSVLLNTDPSTMTTTAETTVGVNLEKLPQEESSDATPDLESSMQALASLAIPRVIHNRACAALPANVDMRKSMLNTLKTAKKRSPSCPGIPTLVDIVYDGYTHTRGTLTTLQHLPRLSRPPRSHLSSPAARPQPRRPEPQAARAPRGLYMLVSRTRAHSAAGRRASRHKPQNPSSAGIHAGRPLAHTRRGARVRVRRGHLPVPVARHLRSKSAAGGSRRVSRLHPHVARARGWRWRRPPRV